MQQLKSETTLEHLTPNRILIADDHLPTRVGLREIVMRNFSSLRREDILEAGSIDDTIRIADEMFTAVKEHGSGVANGIVIFLDVMFNEPMSATATEVRTGITAARAIWEAHPTARILIVSSSTITKHVENMYDIIKGRGAWGWIPKDKVDDASVLNAVQSVLNGRNCIDPTIRDLHDLAEEGEALSSDEIETILYVGTGLTDDAVGAKFPSEGKRSKHGVLSDRAIQARLRNVYIKLGIKDYDQNDGGIFNERCRAVWTCLKNGIITVEDFALKERELESGSATRSELENKVDQIKGGKDNSRLEKVRAQIDKAKKALETKEKQLGADDLELTDWLYKLADLHTELKEFAAALPLYERIRSIESAQCATDDPRLAKTLTCLATCHCHHEKRDLEKAITFYKTAMKLLTGVQEIPVADRDGSNRVEHLSFVAKLVKMPKPTKNTVAEFFDKYGEFLETFGREYIQTKYQSKSKSDQFAYLEWVKAQAEEAENLSKKLKLANWAG